MTAAEETASMVQVLCDRIPQAEDNAEHERRNAAGEKSMRDVLKVDYRRAADDRDRARSRADQAERQSRQLRDQFDDADRGRLEVLRRYDTLTNELYLYMVELAGHRDTGKTKAERIALGHVVARLAELRVPNAAEAEELGLPAPAEAAS